MHGQIGQNLAVHFDTGQRQTIDKARICQRFVVGAHSRVDPLNPQGAEIPLAVLAVTGRVLVGLVDRLAGNFKGALAAAVIAFCLIENLFVTGVSGRATFNSGH